MVQFSVRTVEAAYLVKVFTLKGGNLPWLRIGYINFSRQLHWLMAVRLTETICGVQDK